MLSKVIVVSVGNTVVEIILFESKALLLFLLKKISSQILPWKLWDIGHGSFNSSSGGNSDKCSLACLSEMHTLEDKRGYIHLGGPMLVCTYMKADFLINTKKLWQDTGAVVSLSHHIIGFF